MKTIKERAEKAVAIMIDNRDEALVSVVAEILQELVEDCASIARNYRRCSTHLHCKRRSDLVAQKIQALGEPKETKHEDD